MEAAARFTRTVSICALLVSLLVLTGWAADIPLLTRIAPGWPRMVALTALSFGLTAISLWFAAPQPANTAPLFARGSARSARQHISYACASLVVLISVVRLVAYLFGWDVGWLERLALPADSSGHMSPATALGFSLLGGGLLAAGQPPPRTQLHQVMATLALCIGWLGLARFVLGGVPLAPWSAMAVHTALLILILSMGVLSVRPDTGLAALLLSAGAGGKSVRHLLPAALLLPLFAGALTLYGMRAGWFGAEAGLAVLALTCLIVFAGFVWSNAANLDRADKERWSAESALRESQELLQAIVDNSEAVVYVKDLTGRYLLVNRRFEQIFRRDRAAILGRTDHHFFTKEAADAFRDMDIRAASAEQALTEEETVPQADGTHTYISVKAPLRDAAGKTYGVFGISTDITDRKRVEDRLLTQLARLNLLDQTTRAIGERQDLHSIFQVVIRSLEEHMPIDFGCACLYDSVQQGLSITCVGDRGRTLVPELALPEDVRIAVDSNGLGRCVSGQLVHESNIEGSPFPFTARLAHAGLRSLVLAPLVVESKVFGIMVAARREADSFSSSDCEFLRQLSDHVALAAHQAQLYTALQTAYEELRQTQQAFMQQERLRALGQMASGIAHDINNALSPAALYVQSLLEHDTTLGEQARSQLDITQRAIEDVASTIARMREFYRPRESQLSLVPVDLNVILQQVVELTHARWSNIPQERGILIDLRKELETSLPTVLGAESEIRDALTNLVLNAVDAMPNGGTLTLRTRSHTGTVGSSAVSVEVCDTGVGMSEAVRSRCLEPFFTTKGERGTGLGLAMVYGMVQRHGADLEIDSEPGAGTTVRLVFSVAMTSAPSADLTNRLPPRNLRILIVDDDPLLLSSLQATLALDGHAIQVAEGGQEGIDVLSLARQDGTPFDVVVTDLGMPHIDGRAVAAAVKSMTPGTPVILLTGWGYRLQAENDVPQDVDRVLSKPPKPGELRAALADLTG